MRGKKLKRVIAFLSVLALMGSLLTPIMASAATYSNDGSSGCEVIANVSSTFNVTVPATLALSKNSSGAYTGTYEIGVSGSIGTDQYVSVTPASSFVMTGSKTSSKVTATVSQPVTKWTGYTTSDSDSIKLSESTVKTNGTVTANLKNTDSYKGTLTFSFSLVTK
jgi:hypothetical protein